MLTCVFLRPRPATWPLGCNGSAFRRRRWKQLRRCENISRRTTVF